MFPVSVDPPLIRSHSSFRGSHSAGLIVKQIGEEVREQTFIRVDTHSDRDAAIAFSITKAKQIIDEQGDRLFETERR
ncbi:MAG: HlyU family transcriptional regulator [Geminicoccaceae bacterium]|nr:HlyU family transcriptional regulator [Geminicoccaceae bacterium]